MVHMRGLGQPAETPNKRHLVAKHSRQCPDGGFPPTNQHGVGPEQRLRHKHVLRAKLDGGCRRARPESASKHGVDVRERRGHDLRVWYWLPGGGRRWCCSWCWWWRRWGCRRGSRHRAGSDRRSEAVSSHRHQHDVHARRLALKLEHQTVMGGHEVEAQPVCVSAGHRTQRTDGAANSEVAVDTAVSSGVEAVHKLKMG